MAHFQRKQAADSDIGKPMRTYPRRGYFPDDADSAYKRWRAKEASVIPMSRVAANAFEVFVKPIWLAGWHARGEVAYGEPDTSADS